MYCLMLLQAACSCLAGSTARQVRQLIAHVNIGQGEADTLENIAVKWMQAPVGGIY